ncbi:QRFP-like peptide receptor [Babylonia areolata]|uniref:QRFP-like peptide receptor n=1 Tax=Babylonia areolata TaxID=304850 RepID=UPI003FD12003
MRLYFIFMASVVVIYGHKTAPNLALLHKLVIPQGDVVDTFLDALNKSDPREIQGAIRMVCHKLNTNVSSSVKGSSLSLKTCDRLLSGRDTAARSYRLAGDLVFTDVKVSRGSELALMSLFSLELLVSVVGNSLVMWGFACCRQMRSVTNVFIVSLAASDLLMTLSSIPLNIAQVLTGFWQFGPTVCKLGPFTTQLSVAASSLILCCIAFDRYVAVVRPLRLSTIQSPRRAALLMVGVWVVALGSASPFLYYQRLLKLCEWPSPEHEAEAEGHGEEEEEEGERGGGRYGHGCVLYCGMPASLQWLHCMTYVVLLLIPMMLMGASYAVIIAKLWLRQPPAGRMTVGVEAFRQQYKRRAIKMLFLVLLIFLGCWMPLLTFDLLAKLLRLPLRPRLVTLRYFLQCVALSCPCLNPIVYTILHDKFRKNFGKLCSFCPSFRRVTPLPAHLPPQPLPRPPIYETDSSVVNGPEKIFHVEPLQQTWVVKFGPNRTG